MNNKNGIDLKTAIEFLIFSVVGIIILSLIGYLMFSIVGLGDIGAIVGAIFAIFILVAAFLEGTGKTEHAKTVERAGNVFLGLAGGGLFLIFGFGFGYVITWILYPVIFGGPASELIKVIGGIIFGLLVLSEVNK